MKQKDELLDHDYDGIQEYDNDLPRWWLALFVGGILFGIVYVGLFHVGNWKFASEQLETEMAALQEQMQAAAPTTDENSLSRDALLQLVSNSEALVNGKEIFIAKCASCHLAQGQGLVGPNLTDDYWIHGGDITDIRHIIEVGVLDKGMIAWGPMLKAEEISNVSAYVWSLHGTLTADFAGAKAPQGEYVDRTQLPITDTNK
jgi:cytochrome c oxidase cbb3-type subunit 3